MTSSQLSVAKQEPGMNQPYLEDFHDASFIIMSPTNLDKEDIIIDYESKKYTSSAGQLLLAHDEEVQLDASERSVRNATIKT